MRTNLQPTSQASPCWRQLFTSTWVPPTVSAAADKTYAELDGADHYLRSPWRERAADEIILPWLRERWPA